MQPTKTASHISEHHLTTACPCPSFLQRSDPASAWAQASEQQLQWAVAAANKRGSVDYAATLTALLQPAATAISGGGSGDPRGEDSGEEADGSGAQRCGMTASEQQQEQEQDQEVEADDGDEEQAVSQTVGRQRQRQEGGSGGENAASGAKRLRTGSMAGGAGAGRHGCFGDNRAPLRQVQR